jgi:hypothetical protein
MLVIASTTQMSRLESLLILMLSVIFSPSSLLTISEILPISVFTPAPFTAALTLPLMTDVPLKTMLVRSARGVSFSKGLVCLSTGNDSR